jgi:glucans biosynthesis protein
MWSWGDGRERPARETRPKVHDCDGLMVHTAGDEWLWRPLTRLSYPSLSRFPVAGLRGFGLLQRDRRPASFRDDEAKYHLRPSVWITPKRPWPAGAVELLELPSKDEIEDNIAAWWTPDAAIDVRVPLDLEYTVAFNSAGPDHRLARAVALRVLRRAGQPVRLEIDFAGGPLAQLPADARLSPRVTPTRGDVANIACRKQPDGRWQLSFDVRPAAADPVELSASLTKDGKALAETWQYLCHAPSRMVR